MIPGEASCAFPAVVVPGWVEIQMTMGPRLPSPVLAVSEESSRHNG
jgi:hypothetical protein